LAGLELDLTFFGFVDVVAPDFVVCFGRSQSHASGILRRDVAQILP
jgi:hypothetical protein